MVEALLRERFQTGRVFNPKLLRHDRMISEQTETQVQEAPPASKPAIPQRGEPVEHREAEGRRRRWPWVLALIVVALLVFLFVSSRSKKTQ
ncbi:MAG TPA: hypothetical protein VMM92_00725, partial [Thermoanaerobaculia bacterium]|nr:hypothetical protein [Thermoanaerobaculia bacterium]